MNPALFLLLVTLGLSAACLLICRLADDTYTEPAPEAEAEPVVPAADQCAVTECPREWQTNRTGWQLCWHHYRELVTDRRAS